MTTRRPAAPVVSSVAALAVLLSGCSLLVDPPVDAEDVPLEVVVGDGQCLLNVGDIRAGLHLVYVIGEPGGGSARVVGPDGTLVFEGDDSSIPQDIPEDGKDEPVPAPPPMEPEEPVRLEAGTYRVECAPDSGAASSVSMLVKPARPGYGGTPQN